MDFGDWEVAIVPSLPIAGLAPAEGGIRASMEPIRDYVRKEREGSKEMLEGIIGLRCLSRRLLE